MAEASKVMSEMEPVDLNKKQLIEEVFEPDLDTAIVKLANSRKQIPTRCVRRARATANNNIMYYGKVCVSIGAESKKAEEIVISETETNALCEADLAREELELPTSLSSFSKTITDCLGKQQDLLNVYHSLRHSSEPTKQRIRFVPENLLSNDFVEDLSL